MNSRFLSALFPSAAQARAAAELQPADSLFLFVDYQAGLAFGVESIPSQAHYRL